MKHTQHLRERGNALFLILIAVALFAALSYAITQSGRGTGTIDRETAMIAAGQIVQYPASLRTAITRMVITGTAVTAIDFTAGAGSAKVFDSAGGGAVIQDVPEGAGGTAAAWIFQDATAAANGYYVKGIGTDTSVSGREVLAALHDISLTVCQQILKGLGLSQTPVVVTTTTVWGTPLATFDTTAGNTISAVGLDGVAFACMRSGALYDYYHTLIEQ